MASREMPDVAEVCFVGAGLRPSLQRRYWAPSIACEFVVRAPLCSPCLLSALCG